MIDPFHAGKVKDFDMWYFVIGVIFSIYIAYRLATTFRHRNVPRR